MTYQRNMALLPLQIDQLGGEAGEDLIEAVQVRTHDQARRQHLAAERAHAANAAAEAAGALDVAARLALRLAGDRRGDGAATRALAVTSRGSRHRASASPYAAC